MVSFTPKVETLPARRAFEVALDHIRACTHDFLERGWFYRIISAGWLGDLQQRFVFEIFANDPDHFVEFGRRADRELLTEVGAVSAGHESKMPARSTAA
jgi:hypothetical protein